MSGYPGHWHYWGAGEVAAHVTTIQYRLKYIWGYIGVSVDGIFGYYTDYWLKDFQSKHGLSVDGIVGPATWAAL